LKVMDLPSLAYRRYRGDMIEVYKYLNGLYPLHSDSILTKAPPSALLGHHYKLLKRQRSTNLRLHFFSFRVTAYACETSDANRGRHPAPSCPQPPEDPHQRWILMMRISLCHTFSAVPTTRASDLSRLNCSPFCRYHCLTLPVHAARTASPAAVLSTLMARWSCVSSVYWW